MYAAESSGDLGPVGNYLLASGPAGLFAFALLMGWIYSRSAYKELQQDRDAWKAALERSEDARAEERETAKSSLELTRLIHAQVTRVSRKKA